MQIPYRKTKDGVTIQVKVQPRSSRRGIEGVDGDIVNVYLTSPPVGGAANEQLIEVLSEALGVKKSALHILRGTSSRYKVIVIRGVEKV
jgi:uncharacterized protein (TIGR00251 family)